MSVSILVTKVVYDKQIFRRRLLNFFYDFEKKKIFCLCFAKIFCKMESPSKKSSKRRLFCTRIRLSHLRKGLLILGHFFEKVKCEIISL